MTSATVHVSLTGGNIPQDNNRYPVMQVAGLFRLSRYAEVYVNETDARGLGHGQAQAGSLVCAEM
jgi:hypothetical protein